MDPSSVQSLAGIDWTIIIVYMVGVFFIGLWYSRYVAGAGDLFLAGKSLPFWAIGMSIVVSDIGATDFIFVGGSAYKHGVSVANFDWMGSMPAMVFAAFIFAPYFWRSGVYTIPEFLGKRYNTTVQMLHATLWGVFMLIMLGVMLATTGSFLNQVLGWNTTFSIWFMVVVVGLYTVSGGLAAVVMTDVIQMIVMYVGGLSMMLLCIWEVGGWSKLKTDVLALGPEYQHHFTLLLPNDAATPYPWTGIVLGLGLIMATAYMSGNQAVIQRCFGARSEWDAKAGMLFGGFLKSFIPLMVALPGLAAILVVPGLEEGDRAIPAMISKLLPPGLKGLMFSALFAALMSSVDSYLNSASTIWTTDLYGRYYKVTHGKAPSEANMLVVGRIFTIIFVVSAAIIGPMLVGGSMYVFIQTALSMFQGPVFAILLLGILWKRANQWGGMAGLILGVMFTVILKNTKGLFLSEDPFLFIAWWSFVFSFIVTIVVSLLTPADPEEKLRGLTFGQVMKDGKMQRVLLERVS